MSKARKLITAAAGVALATGIALAIPGTAFADAGYTTVGPAGLNAYHGGYDVQGHYVTYGPGGPSNFGGGYAYPG